MQPPLHIAFIGCILHISVLVNIGCFDIGCILHIGVLVNKGIMKWVSCYQSCIMSSHSRIESRTVVLTLGVASGQYSCPRLNTTALGHNAGLISTHPFNNTLVIIVVHMTNSGQVAVQKRLHTR